MVNTLDLSADGTEILRQCMVGDTEVKYELRAIRVDGQGSRLVAQIPGFIIEPPRFSPDGQRLALSLNRGGPVGAPAGDILTMASTGGDYHAIDLPGDPLVIDLSWSPDGDWLVFSTGAAIEAVNVQTEDHRTVASLAGATGQLRYPLWLPSNDAIIYSDYGDSSFAIRRIDLRSGQTTALVTEGGDWGEPVLSPDGRSVLYKGVGGLWSVGLDGSDGGHLVVDGFQGRFLRAARLNTNG
jgi:Tol biopolymer transport system component